MTYEQKYKEALERAKQFQDRELFAECNGNLVEYIFPELKESEDEKIRKALIEYFESHHDDTEFFGVKVIDILSWLEKQGEQKPIEWGKEDVCHYEDIFAILKGLFWNEHYPEEAIKSHIYWFKSLKDKVLSQTKQE